jgi:O-antigen/teichoic acid export membrane protein
VPDDYGLMAMSTIFTGYVEVFSELGLGAAIIQRESVTKSQLSSIFWFSMGFNLILALTCLPIAYFTADILNEPRVIPLTQTVSVLFILTGLQVVPLNLLKKELDFKSVGLIEMTVTLISCVGMVLMAIVGFGVWTLLGGRIVRAFSKLLFLYFKIKWIPFLHCNFREIKSLIKFGFIVATSRTIFYMWEKSDRFFAGRIWPAHVLGYYSLALQLAQIPTEKIITLINQVSFSALSKFQNDDRAFKNFYLNTTKISATFVLPLFLGGYLVSEDVIKLILGDKWLPVIFLFKYLCLSQIFTALNAINNFTHAARGEPVKGLIFDMICLVFLPVSFFISVQYGLNAIVIPWLTVYIFICLGWIFFTVIKIDVGVVLYLKNLKHPIIASLIMSLCVGSNRFYMISNGIESLGFRFLVSILIGAVVYICYFLIFEKDYITSVVSVFRGKSIKKAQFISSQL